MCGSPLMEFRPNDLIRFCKLEHCKYKNGGIMSGQKCVSNTTMHWPAHIKRSNVSFSKTDIDSGTEMYGNMAQ